MRLSIRLTLVMVALVGATTIGILFFTNRALENVIERRALVQAETHVRLLANRLEDRLDEIRRDVLLVASTSAVHDYARMRINGQAKRVDGPMRDAQWFDRIDGFVQRRVAANSHYLKLSIIGIDDGGRELLRADWSGPKYSVHRVPNGELLRKGDTDYFKETMKLAAGEVYISRVTLDGERDRVLSPNTPVIQVATPITAPDGSRHGIVVITADVRPMLNELRSAVNGMSLDVKQFYVIGDHGEYLIHPDRNKEFVPGSGMKGNFMNSVIDLAGMLNTDQSQSRIITDDEGLPFGAAVAPVRPTRGAWFGVVAIVPYAEIMAPIKSVQRASMLVGLVTLSIAIGIAALMSRSIAQPIAQMNKAINAFSPDKPLVMPDSALRATGEIGVLAHTFDHMAEEVRRKTEELKRDSLEREQMKDEFVAMVSHELRTPLTSISASLGLLIADPSNKLSDAAMRLMRIAHSNSQRLVRLINDVLDIEKIESGKIEFQLKAVEVIPLVEQAIEANRGYADQFEASVRLDPTSVRSIVVADSDRLTQVITNLLSNAVKYSPPHGEVLVTVSVSGTMVRIAVRDHGSGIPEKFRSKIFEKFAQADSTDVRQKGGTGLGLSIVKQIAQRLGGDAGFYEAPGGGTVFHVDLPRAERQTVAGAEEAAVAAAAKADAGRRVDAAREPREIELIPNKEVA